jgi:hypothetical protein
MSKHRVADFWKTLLGFAVLGFIFFQTARAWLVANWDVQLSRIGHRAIEWESFAFYALTILGIVLLRAQSIRRPAQGVSHPVALADIDPIRGVRNDGSRLEQLTTELIVRDGGIAQRTGGAGDGGIDVVGTGANGRPVVVQCKQYAPEHVIGPAPIRELVGAAHLTGNNPVVIFVTTASGFSAQARAEAHQGGVVLVDRQRLHAWMSGGELTELAGPRAPRTSRVKKLLAGGEQLRQRFSGATGRNQWPG